MKKIFLLLILSLTLPNLSYAGSVKLSEMALSELNSLNFKTKVYIAFENNANGILYKCSPVPNAFANEDKGFNLISGIHHCAFNLKPWKVHQVFFFKNKGRIYLRHCKTLESITYEIKFIDSDNNTVYVGKAIDIDTIYNSEADPFRNSIKN